jgi:cytoplasmic iron level regulating protein YaaA (DUF328/UPF0246 family)
MKILLAPSESKIKGGNENLKLSFEEINKKRFDILKRYNEFLQTTNDTKNFGDDKTSIFKRRCLDAIKRYNGVAFKHLDYESLDTFSKEWLNENLLIFSNLFGILKPTDKIPYYILKQGAKPGFDIYKEYKEFLTPILDKINQKEVFIDLRAKFYEKIYTPKNSITFKFIKNGKIVSHFAKAYRGKLARTIAIYKPSTIDELLKIDFDVKIVEIIERKGKKEIVCEV